MTERLKSMLMEKLGEATGETRYDQLRDFCRIHDLPMDEPIGRQRTTQIGEEAMIELRALSVSDWIDMIKEYREKSTRIVKLATFHIDDFLEIMINYKAENSTQEKDQEV